MRGSPDKTEDGIEARLLALAGAGRVDLLSALFTRMKNVKDGVDAERFRIAFKDRRDEIDELRRWFINETDEPKRIYRPSLLALPLIEDERAGAVLVLIDRVLCSLVSAYEAEPGCQVTLEELSGALRATAEEVGAALFYVIESPASGSRSTGYPEGPAWYIMPGEQSLNYPDLGAVLREMTKRAERAANAPSFTIQDGVPVMTPPEPPSSWLKEHWKGLAKSIGSIVAFLASLAAIIKFLFR